MSSLLFSYDFYTNLCLGNTVNLKSDITTVVPLAKSTKGLVPLVFLVCGHLQVGEPHIKSQPVVQWSLEW